MDGDGVRCDVRKPKFEIAAQAGGLRVRLGREASIGWPRTARPSYVCASDTTLDRDHPELDGGDKVKVGPLQVQGARRGDAQVPQQAEQVRLRDLTLRGAFPGLGSGIGRHGPAKRANFKFFQSPSGNIACAMGGGIVRCDILEHSWSPPPKPSSCDLDWGNGVAGRPPRPGRASSAPATRCSRRATRCSVTARRSSRTASSARASRRACAARTRRAATGSCSPVTT